MELDEAGPNWREAVLRSLLRWTALLGGVVAASVLAFTLLREPQRIRSFAFASMYLPYLLLLALVYTPVSYSLRAWGLTLTTLLAAAGGLFTFGSAPGPVLASCLGVIAARLFLGRFAMLLALTIAALNILLMGFVRERYLLSELPGGQSTGLFVWLREAAGFSALTGALAALVSHVVERVESGLRRASAALEQLHQEEQHGVRVKAALAATEQALLQSQKMEALGRLAAGVGHDFNNTLQVITAWASHLQGETAPDLILDGLREVETAALKGAELPRRLLAFGRRKTRAPVLASPDSSMRALAGALRRLLPSDIAVELQLQNVPRVLVDEGELDHVLLNLGINARDAMPDGGRLVLGASTVQSSELPAHVPTTGTAARWAHLWVEDNGTGMTEETKSHSFELFYTTKGDNGTGLGLSMAYAVVTNSHGVIHLESERGRGTTVHIYLPESVDVPPETTTEGRSGRHVRGAVVLLAEDDAATRISLGAALEAAGFRVIGCVDAESALEQVLRQPEIQVLCTDGVMPGGGTRRLISGFEAKFPTGRVMICSGYREDDLRQRGLDVGRHHYVPKPVAPTQLIGVIRELLRQANAPARCGP